MNNPLKFVDPLGLAAEGMGQTNASTIMALDKLYSQYEANGNTSGMDATISLIWEIQKGNGVALREYTFSSDDITTTVSVIRSNKFSLDDIHELHKNNYKMAFLAGATPETGPVMGPLFSFVAEMEQNGENSSLTTAKNVGLAAFGVKHTKVGLMASGVDTDISLNQEKSDTYYRDGVTIQEGDS